MNKPYNPIHSKEWLEKYLSTNYYKKKYDRYMWWRSYTPRKAPLTNKHPLRDRILNGDYDLGPFVFEIELVQHRMNTKSLEHKHEDTFQEETQVDKARIKRLKEDRDKDEVRKLSELRKAFVFEFKMTKEQYDREVIKPQKDLISFYYKMESRFGKRGVLSSFKPKGLVLAKERNC